MLSTDLVWLFQCNRLVYWCIRLV